MLYDTVSGLSSLAASGVLAAYCRSKDPGEDPSGESEWRHDSVGAYTLTSMQ